MKCYLNLSARLLFIVLPLLFSIGLKAQEADNEFSLDAQLVTRGELRVGGFKPDDLGNERISRFAQGKYLVTASYQRSWLEIVYWI